MYYSLGLRGNKIEDRKRGSAEDVNLLPMLWVEIDHNDGIHSEKNLPAPNDVMPFVQSVFPLAPSFVIDSGGGYHLYWLFDSPLELHSAEVRQEVQELLYKFSR